MINTEKEKFETLWSDFCTLVKGKLLTTAQKQTLSTPLATLILTDAAGSWNDEYSMYGRWLHQLSQTDVAKAELIKEVLLKDMNFAEVEQSSVLPAYYNYLVPSISACAGYAVSRFLGLGLLGDTALAILPAVISYPAVKQYRKNQANVAVGKTIASYMEQLEKYKNSVLSILS